MLSCISDLYLHSSLVWLIKKKCCLQSSAPSRVISCLRRTVMSGLKSLFFLMISFATRKISCFLTHSLKQKLKTYSKHRLTFLTRKAKAHLELDLPKDVKGKKAASSNISICHHSLPNFCLVTVIFFQAIFSH